MPWKPGRATEQFLDKETGTGHVDDITSLYNAAGQITATTNIQDGTATDRQCYTYDQLGELTQAWTDTAGVAVTGSPSVPNIGHCTTTTPTLATVGGPAPYWQTFGTGSGLASNSAGNRTTETDHDTTGGGNDTARTFTYTGSQPDTLTSQSHTGPGASTDTYTYYADGSTKNRIIAGGPNQSLTYTPQGQTESITDSSVGRRRL